MVLNQIPEEVLQSCLHLELEVDQTKVAGHLAHYFSTMADEIGGDNVQNLMAVDFNHHRSVRYISTNLPNATSEQFAFTPLSTKQVQETLEKLNPSKATRLTQEHLKSEAENYSTIAYWDLQSKHKKCSVGNTVEAWRMGPYL